MSIQHVVLALQVIVPPALFGAVILAAASSGIARLFGLRRRPFRFTMRSRPAPSSARRTAALRPVPVAAATSAALQSRATRSQNTGT